MAYYLRQSETLQIGLQRIISENIGLASKMLNSRKNIHEEVHEARRQFKMARAVLRLVRKMLGDKLYKQKNEICRNTARKLSLFRDSSAILETLDMLKTKYPAKLQTEWFADLTLHIDQQRKELTKAFISKNGTLTDVVTELAAQKEELQGLGLEKAKLSNLLMGLKKVYQRGYQQFQRNTKKIDADHLHHWRKSSKYLRFQLTILKNAWLSPFNAWIKELQLLTDYLGDYQNLRLLKQALTAEGMEILPENKELLQQLASDLQNKLLESALDLGGRIYAETPDMFTKRLRAYLKGFVG